MVAEISSAQNQSLAGQHVAIVGASSGVGLALTRLCTTQGARLTVFARNLEKLRSSCRDLPGVNVRHLDLLNGLSIESALAGITEIDHLVIPAGTFMLAPFLEGAAEQWRATLEERIIGPLTIIKRLVPTLRRSITLFSGGVARRPVPGGAMLAGAAAAVESLCRALALELAPLRVNAVAPGMLDTPMVDKALGPHKDQAFTALSARVPARRIGRAEDAAHAVLFLMTNPYMTAATVEIDGGSKLV